MKTRQKRQVKHQLTPAAYVGVVLVVVQIIFFALALHGTHLKDRLIRAADDIVSVLGAYEIVEGAVLFTLGVCHLIKVPRRNVVHLLNE